MAKSKKSDKKTPPRLALFSFSFKNLSEITDILLKY